MPSGLATTCCTVSNDPGPVAAATSHHTSSSVASELTIPEMRYIPDSTIDNCSR